MSFDFKFTCPEIDKEVDSIKAKLDEIFEPLFKTIGVDWKSDKGSLTDKVYNNVFKPYIETVRETNSNMRNAAEEQILELERNIEYLEKQIEKNGENN